jgi:Fe-S oxidoreductase
VVLFADTITNFHEPAIGRSAVAVLESVGRRVIVPRVRCCGRPALSQGLVETAVRDMRANVRALAPYATRGLTIVVPEPSCASALREDMPDLLANVDNRDAVDAVAASIVTLDEFVASLPAGSLRLEAGPASALLHVHCHQRSATGIAPSVKALQRIPGLQVTEPDAGCCGMAGAFGYEAEHYEVSLAMAERRLAPAVRAAASGSWIVAPGASCRQQIAHTSGREAVHPIELIASCLAGGAGSA